MDRQPEARGQPADVIEGLDEVGRARRAGLVVGSIGHGDPAERAQVWQEVGSSKIEAIASASAIDVPARIADREPRRSRPLGSPAGGQPVAAPARAVDDEAIGAGEQIQRGADVNGARRTTRS